MLSGVWIGAPALSSLPIERCVMGVRMCVCLCVDVISVTLPFMECIVDLETRPTVHLPVVLSVCVGTHSF